MFYFKREKSIGLSNFFDRSLMIFLNQLCPLAELDIRFNEKLLDALIRFTTKHKKMVKLIPDGHFRNGRTYLEWY
jgi:hypothetical protein